VKINLQSREKSSIFCRYFADLLLIQGIFKWHISVLEMLEMLESSKKSKIKQNQEK